MQGVCKREKNESVPFRLTREETAIADVIASNIHIKIDQKKAIAIHVTIQPLLVTAIVADTVQALLKAHMTKYRTNKARRILEYNEKLCKETHVGYHTV